MRGQPMVELARCLRDEAYKTRAVDVPLRSHAYGILSSCEVRVGRFEGAIVPGGPDEERQALDWRALQTATAAIIQYRRCVGR